jgi:hypothetical protein
MNVVYGAEKRNMDEPWQYRLTVVGSGAELRRLGKSHWNRRLNARHGELLENSPGRITWQFDSTGPLLERLKALSRHWPQLILLLDYEMERQRTKGLAKAQAGRVEHCQFEY